MEIETTQIKPPGWEDSGPLNPSLLNLDINSLIAGMKQSRTWVEGNLNSIVLFKSPDKQIVISALHEDTEVILKNEVDSVTVYIIEGRMQFQTRDETIILNKDQLITLHDKMKYSLTTLETTVFLLTIENSNSHRLEN
jgi:hypothetical protein